MDNLFILLFLVSFLAIFVFGIKGILNRLKKMPAKTNWKRAGISALVFIGSFIGFGLTSETVPVDDSSASTAVSTHEPDKQSQAESEAKEKAEAESKAQAESEAKKEAEAESQSRAESEAKEKAIAESESQEKAVAESNAEAENKIMKQAESQQSSPQSVPSGNAYIAVNNNNPYFTNEDITSPEAYETYGALDSLGRVTVANAVLGVELMPAEERGDISSVEPTGWDQARYSNVSGGWLYNRSHLIGFQLTGENANPRNLITGTRWFNVEGMLPIENYVADYIETTENHVRYRITPVFEGTNLLASGVYMEGFSIEDNGKGIRFNVYVPNRQPGVEINYANGSNVGPEGPIEEDTLPEIPQSSSPPATQTEPEPEPETPSASPSGDVSSVDANGNGTVTIQEAKDAGFSMPIKSDHWLYQYMRDNDSDGMVGE